MSVLSGTFMKNKDKNSNSVSYGDFVVLFDEVRDYVMNLMIPKSIHEETEMLFDAWKNLILPRIEGNGEAKMFYFENIEPLVIEFLSILERDAIHYEADVDYTVGLMEKILSSIEYLEERYI